MGSTHSTSSEEAGCQTGTSGSSSVTDNNYNVNFGFNLQEAHYLSLLYSCLRYEAEQKSEDHSSSFLTIIWRCSHLLALSLSTSSPPNNDINTNNDSWKKKRSESSQKSVALAPLAHGEYNGMVAVSSHCMV